MRGTLISAFFLFSSIVTFAQEADLDTNIMSMNESTVIQSPTALPSPFAIPRDPMPGLSSSCNSCASNKIEKPYIGNDGNFLMNIALVSNPYIEIDGLFSVRFGNQKAYSPIDWFSIIPADAPQGKKNFITVCEGAKKILFKTKTGKIEDAEPVSSNTPGAYLKRNGNKLMIGNPNSKIEYIYESIDNGITWKFSSARRLDFTNITLTCEYSKSGELKTIILPGDLHYTFEMNKKGIVDKLIGPDGEQTFFAWDEKGLLLGLRTLIPPSHPLYPTNPTDYKTKEGQNIAIRDIHCEYNDAGKLTSIIEMNGEKFTAEYRSDKDEKDKTVKSLTIKTNPDALKEFCEIIRSTDGSRSIKFGNVIANDKNSEVLDVVKEIQMKRMNGVFAISSEKVDGIERNFEYSGDSANKTDALGNKIVYQRNKQGLRTVQTNSDGTTTKYAYDSIGRIISETDSVGNITKYEYASDGRIISKEFPDGLNTSYLYNDNGLPIQVIAPDGTIFRYEWDKQLRLTALVNPDGTRMEWTYKGSLWLPFSKAKVANNGKDKYTLGYTYDSFARLITRSYSDGTSESWKYGCCDVTEYYDRTNAVTKYAYDTSGRKVLEVSPNGEKTSYSYDYRRRLVKIVFPDKTFEEKSYNAINKIASMTFRDGTSVVYDYDKAGRNIKTTWQDGSFSEFKYDVSERLLSVFGTHQKNIDYVYNTKGDLISESDFGLPRATKPRITYFEYDKTGRMLKRTSPDGSAISYFYNTGTGRLIETLEKGIITHVEYDLTGKILSISKFPAIELTQKMTGNEKKAFYSKNIVERRSYDSFGNLFETYAQSRLVTRYLYRPDNGLVESVIRPVSDNGATKDNYVYTYNSDGVQEIAVYRKFIEAANWGLSNWDESKVAHNVKDLGMLVEKSAKKGNRVLWNKDALGNKTEFNYDLTTGYLISVMRNGEKVASYGYDAYGRQIEDTDILGRVTKSVYDKSGNIEMSILPDGSKSSIKHDAFGRMIKTEGVGMYGGAYPTSCDYSNFNELTSRIDGNGSITNFDYDSNGKMTRRIWANGSTVEYKYNSNGYLCQKIETGRISIYDYDPMGRLALIDIKQTDSDNKVLSYTIKFEYDTQGNLIKAIDKNKGTFEIAYDQFGHIIVEKGPFSILESKYNAKGLLIEKRCKINGTAQAFITKYTYDELDRVSKVTSSAGEYTYTYDLLGRISVLSGPNYIEKYNYDKANRLISKTLNDQPLCSYEYDSMDRRIKAEINGVKWEYNYDQLGQLVYAKSSDDKIYDYTYDKIGNILTFKGEKKTYNSLNQISMSACSYDAWGNMTNTPDGWKYTWNTQNRLIVAEKGNKRLEFTYDFAGRRIEKKVFETGQLKNYERYVYDGFRQIAKLDALNNNTILQQFTWNGESLLDLSDGTKSYFCIRDGSKNITRLLDASGNLEAQYEYSPFGNVVVQKGAYAYNNPFRFSSEYADDETGLIYYNYRYYNPNHGRWLSKDPIEEQGGINLYSFVDNSPINTVDRYGLFGLPWPNPKKCKTITGSPFEIKAAPWGVNLAISLNISHGTCTNCCESSGKEVTDTIQNIAISGAYSPPSYTTFGATVGPVTWWAGVKVTATLAGNVAYTIYTDSCNDNASHGGGCGSISIRGTLSGGAEIIYTSVVTIGIGAQVYGYIEGSWQGCIKGSGGSVYLEHQLCATIGAGFKVTIALQNIKGEYSERKCLSLGRHNF